MGQLTGLVLLHQTGAGVAVVAGAAGVAGVAVVVRVIL